MGNDIEENLVQLWGKVGFIVNLSQMIEYNLSNILAFDEILREFEDKESMTILEFNDLTTKANEWYKKLQSKPLGNILKRVKEVEFFSIDTIERIKAMCEERNYVVHQLFKEDLKLKYLKTDPSYYFERLENLIEEMYSINNDLSDILEKQKNEYKLIY